MAINISLLSWESRNERQGCCKVFKIWYNIYKCDLAIVMNNSANLVNGWMFQSKTKLYIRD